MIMRQTEGGRDNLGNCKEGQHIFVMRHRHEVDGVAVSKLIPPKFNVSSFGKVAYWRSHVDAVWRALDCSICIHIYLSKWICNTDNFGADILI